MQSCFCVFDFIVVFIAVCQSQAKIKLKSKQKTTDLERLEAKTSKNLINKSCQNLSNSQTSQGIKAKNGKHSARYFYRFFYHCYLHSHRPHTCQSHAYPHSRGRNVFGLFWCVFWRV